MGWSCATASAVASAMWCMINSNTVTAETGMPPIMTCDPIQGLRNLVQLTCLLLAKLTDRSTGIINQLQLEQATLFGPS